MKKLLLLGIALIFSFAINAQNTITENFESGLPTSAPSNETTATLSSGIWKLKGTFGNRQRK